MVIVGFLLFFFLSPPPSPDLTAIIKVDSEMSLIELKSVYYGSKGLLY